MVRADLRFWVLDEFGLTSGRGSRKVCPRTLTSLIDISIWSAILLARRTPFVVGVAEIVRGQADTRKCPLFICVDS